MEVSVKTGQRIEWRGRTYTVAEIRRAERDAYGRYDHTIIAKSDEGAPPMAFTIINEVVLQ